MQPPPQQMFVPSSGSNGTGSIRPSQPTTNIYRGPPTSTQPRSGTRHVPMQMYPQPIHQNVVMPTYTQFGPRQPTYQGPQYSYSQTLPQYYSSYQFYQPMQQPQSHQRAPSGVGVNVNVGSAISVQQGPSGPPGASQAQIPLAPGGVLAGAVPPGSSAVLGVNSSGPGQQQVGVSMSPMVGVAVPNAAPTQTTQNKSRLRIHALPIIDPDTQRPIVMDMKPKNVFNVDQENQDVISMTSNMQPIVTQKQPDVPIGVSNRHGQQIDHDSHSLNIFNLDMSQIQRDVISGQTPVVSAKSDAPSVEIRPSQNQRNKKTNAIPRDEHNKFLSIAKGSEDINNVDQQSKKTEETPAKLVNLEQPFYQNSQALDGSRQALNQCSNIQNKQIELTKSPQQVAETSIQFPIQSSSDNFTNTANQSNVDKEITSNTYTINSTDSNYTDVNSKNCSLNINSGIFESTEQNTLDPPEETISSFNNMKLNEQETEFVTKKSANEFMDTYSFDRSDSGNVNFTEKNLVVEDLTPVSLSSISSEVISFVGSEGKVDKINEIDCNLTNCLDTDIVRDETDRSNIENKASVTDTFQEAQLLKKNSDLISSIEPTSNVTSPSNDENSLDKTTLTSVSVKITNIAPKTENTFQNTATGINSATSASIQISSVADLINYNEGQWSPQNPTGKKQYDRQQLLQLREAKASRLQPDVNNVSIMSGSDNLLPSFARGNNNKNRGVQSIAGSFGSASRGGDSNIHISKQASMSGVNARNSMKGEKRLIHINLSLNQDVKLSETDNAWRPRVLVSSKDNEVDPSIRSQREKEELIRSVRGILNKLTPEKFNTLVEEIIKLKIDSPDKVEDVMVLVFEKAIDEPNFSVSYAQLCHRLVAEVKAQDERMESGTKVNLAAFRSALLDKTEREFTQNVTQRADREKKLQPIMDKIKACTNPTEKIELQVLLEEEERKIRRRSGGTVRFIGELFKISMLTGKIIYHCIDKLLDPKHEDLLECLCKLLTTVGEKFEKTQARDSNSCYSLEKTIERMQAIASKTDKEGAKVSSRVRFMLQDVIDLRMNKWHSSRNEGPKTMEQIDKETKNEQLSSQYLNYGGLLSGSGSGNINSGKRDDRVLVGRHNDSRSSGGYSGSHSQRSDAGNLRRQQQSGSNASGGSNNMSGGNDEHMWQTIPNKGNKSLPFDSNKLDNLLKQNEDMGSKKMGGVHQFIWSSTQRQTAPTSTASNSFAALSSFVDTNKSINERDRDRGGSRNNKGSYNKGSLERDNYNERVIQSRTNSSQGSRENSSSRGNQSGRGMVMASSMQKSTSHKNYSQHIPPRMSGKSTGLTSISSLHSHHRGDQTQQSSQDSSIDSLNNLFPSIPPVAVFEEPSDADLKLMKSVVSEMIEIAVNSKTITTAIVPCINQIKEEHRCGLLYYILTDYLHLASVGQTYRRYVANIVVFLIKHKFISLDHFRVAYKHFCEFASDLIHDVPDLWMYIFEFTGPLIAKEMLSIKDLWIKRLKEDDSPKLGQKFIKAYLLYCTQEIGPRFTKEMWKNHSMKWTDFMPSHEVKNFVQVNKLDYIESECLPEITVKDNKENHISKVVDRVEHLLREGSNHDAIIDYINGNVAEIDKLFIRNLTTVVSNFAINFKDGSYKLNNEVFVKVCIPVLHRYIDQKEERELECLYAMQILVNNLEHPRGLLNDLFVELYENDDIPSETFIKWRDSKDQSAGKGVAVKGLNQFFNQLLSGETSDENN